MRPFTVTPWPCRTRRDRARLAAALLLALSGAGCAAALARAVRLEPLPAPRAPVADANVAPAVVWLASTVASRQAAAELDPYDPDRVGEIAEPAEEDPSSDSAAAPALDPAGALRLLGTVVSPDGSGGFVVCQLGTAPPVSVRAGERVGEHRLQRIEPGRATFVSPDGERLTLHVPRPGSAP